MTIRASIDQISGFCFVVSPLKGNVKLNTEIARALCRYCLFELKWCPVASHLYFPVFLDEDEPLERTLGIALGHLLTSTLKNVKAVVVLSDRVTSGMAEDLKALSALPLVEVTLNELATKGYL